MKRKQWVLLVLCILLLAGYFKFFYKTWSNNTVSRNADCVVALDVKKITNTVIWDFITSPSRWKNISFFSSKKEISWEDMFELPDYVFLFHNQGEPLNTWYSVFNIKDKDDFEKGLQYFHFEKRGANEYYSNEIGIELFCNGRQVLVSNTSENNKTHLQQTAAAIFAKQYIEKDKLQKLVSEMSHAGLQVFSPSFNKYIDAAQFSFDKNELTAAIAIVLPDGVNWPSGKYNYCDTAMCVMGFTQPQPGIQALLDSSTRSLLSRAMNFNIDSLLISDNQFYLLEIEGIHTRIDSAVSYTYDDNFNPVEKKVINSLEEPAFNFSVKGKAPKAVYHYWYNNDKLEHTAEGELFTPMPFVKSYCRLPSGDTLLITSDNYPGTGRNQSIEAIAFFNLAISKLPSSLTMYLPASITKGLGNIEALQARLLTNNGKLSLRINCSKKKNDLPLFSMDW